MSFLLAPEGLKYDRHGRRQSVNPSLLIQKQIDDLLTENVRLDHKLSHNAHSFRDVLIYCKKTIEKQDEQVGLF